MTAKSRTLMSGWESTPAPGRPSRRHRGPLAVTAVPDTTIPPDERVNRPAPLNLAAAEPVAHTRIRALQLAEWYELIGMYIGPIDAANVAPTELQYWYLPKGRTLEDLGRREEPPTLDAAEVHMFCYLLAVASGNEQAIADLRFREGLPW